VVVKPDTASKKQSTKLGMAPLRKKGSAEKGHREPTQAHGDEALTGVIGFMVSLQKRHRQSRKQSRPPTVRAKPKATLLLSPGADMSRAWQHEGRFDHHDPADNVRMAR
jgi:hypothetical protein